MHLVEETIQPISVCEKFLPPDSSPGISSGSISKSTSFYSSLYLFRTNNKQEKPQKAQRFEDIIITEVVEGINNQVVVW